LIQINPVTTSIGAAPAVNATPPHALLMAIFSLVFGASGLFGSVTVNTPFLTLAHHHLSGFIHSRTGRPS
jgi:hypothetical protein